MYQSHINLNAEIEDRSGTPFLRKDFYFRTRNIVALVPRVICVCNKEKVREFELEN